MTTTAKLIEYLQTFPPDTLVKVLEERTVGYTTTTRFVDLKLPQNEYNLSDNLDYIKGSGKGCGLYLGSN